MGKALVKEAQTIGFAIVMVFVYLCLCSFIILTLPYRLCVWGITKLWRRDLISMVTGLSAVFGTERPEAALFNQAHFLVLEGHFPVERFSYLFLTRIFPKKHIYERLMAGVEYFMGYTFWKSDPNFDVRNHIRRYDYTGALALPSPCTEEDLRRVCGGLVKHPWKVGRSPWELLHVHDYFMEDDPNPKTVLTCRNHHALMDGYSLIKLMQVLFQSDYPISTPKFPKLSLPQKILQAFILPVKIPYELAENLLDSWDDDGDWHMHNATHRDFLTSFSRPIQYERIRALKNLHGVSYAGILFTAVCGGMYRMLKEAGAPIPDSLVTPIPVPKPNHPWGIDNYVYIYNTRWKIRAENAVERLKANEKYQEMAKYSSAPLGGDILASTIGLLPTAVTKFIAIRGLLKGSSVIASNFPVSTGTMIYDGHEVLDLISTTGTFGPKIGTAILMAGVNCRQRVSVNIDRKIFPDEAIVSKLKDFIEEELQVLEAGPKNN